MTKTQPVWSPSYVEATRQLLVLTKGALDCAEDECARLRALNVELVKVLEWLNSFEPGSDIPRKILSFAALPNGWHNGSGGPIGKSVITRALRVHLLLVSSGFTHTNAFPGRGGDVLVTAYDGPRYLSIAVEPDGTYSLNHEVNKTEIEYVENVSETIIEDALRQTLVAALEACEMSPERLLQWARATRKATKIEDITDLPADLYEKALATIQKHGAAK